MTKLDVQFSTELAERYLGQMQAANGRRCGSCSLCCRLLDVPQVGKPENDWCPHCRPGKGGCAIYGQRPQVCRDFMCQWLITPELGDEWFPQRAKMVCHIARFEQEKHLNFVVIVDTHFPNRWREEPYFSQLCAISLRGLRGPDRWLTCIYVGDQKFLLLNEHVIETSTLYGIVAPTGPNEWQWVPVETKDDALRLIATTDKMTEMLLAIPEHLAQLFMAKDKDAVIKLDKMLHRLKDAAQKVRREYPNADLMEVTARAIRLVMADDRAAAARDVEEASR